MHVKFSNLYVLQLCTRYFEKYKFGLPSVYGGWTFWKFVSKLLFSEYTGKQCYFEVPNTINNKKKFKNVCWADLLDIYILAAFNIEKQYVYDIMVKTMGHTVLYECFHTDLYSIQLHSSGIS